MVCTKFSTEILSLNPWNRFVSFFVTKAGVNLKIVKISDKSFVACISSPQDVDSASCPCWLSGYQEQCGLQETPKSFVTFSIAGQGHHLKGGICNDLEGDDVIAIGRDRRRIEAVLAFRDLNSVVIDHLPGYERSF